jgi:hypothetical protein
MTGECAPFAAEPSALVCSGVMVGSSALSDSHNLKLSGRSWHYTGHWKMKGI